MSAGVILLIVNMLLFCPLDCEGMSPSTQFHEYPSGSSPSDVQVNMTSFNAATLIFFGLAVTSITITFNYKPC